MGYISLTGNPITFTVNRVNTISSLVLNGKTTQSGTGDPSPTNIRPIYGVGQYDKKVVFDGTKIPTEVTAESATVPNLYQCGFRVGDTTFISICDKFVERQVGFADVTKPSYRTYTNGYIYFREYGLDTKEKWVEYFKSNHVTVYYQSTAYPTAEQVYCGLSITDANGYHGYAAGPTAPLYDGDTVDFATGKCKRTKGYIASYAGEALPGKWISSRDVYAAGATPTTGAQVVYELTTPTTETVPISAPITNAAGTVTLSAENTMNVTYFQLEVSNNKYQDIQITDNTLLTQFQQAWSSGDYTTAFNIIDNNPQLDTKSFVADVINTLTANLTYLQNLNDPTFKADRIQTSATPPVDLQVGQVYFKTL